MTQNQDPSEIRQRARFTVTPESSSDTMNQMEQHHSIITTEAFQEATQRLNEFAMLRAGWDTYDAEPIAATAIHEAGRLLAAVARRPNGRAIIARPFFVAPLPYGGVQIDWRPPNTEIEVEIGPDGRFGYLVMTGEGERRIFTDKDNASADEVVDLIVRLCDGD